MHINIIILDADHVSRSRSEIIPMKSYPGRTFKRRGRGKTRGRTKNWADEKGEEKWSTATALCLSWDQSVLGSHT